MKEEEIRPIAENYVKEYCHLPDGEYTDGSLVCAGIGTALIVSRQLEKRIAELEAQISILLSCKNCPDNKGGLLCQKEYEDKCLAQKIQYIKELKEENAEQLTKAKEIIEKLLPYAKTGKHDKQDLQSIDRFCDSIHKAEQFLKECE